MKTGDAGQGATLARGSRLGAFEILDLVASGGMGSVYRARSVLTGEARALKVIRSDLVANASFVQRFVREIQITASLDHPNLVRVFEPAMADGVMFLPMELLVGETLTVHLARKRVFSLAHTLEILAPVCDAIQKVHERGIIHRDLKPSNIVLEPGAGGRFVPKLLDFGAARRLAGDDEATATGTLIGSVHYMAPEQARGAQDLDARVDQYALAVIAYQMLTGARPYENDETATALAKLLERAPYPRATERVATLPAELDAILSRAMHYDRDERYASVAELEAALAKLVVCPKDAESAETTVALSAEEILARGAARRAPPQPPAGDAPAPPAEPSTCERAAVAAAAPRKANAPPGRQRAREIVALVAVVGVGIAAATMIAAPRTAAPVSAPAASTPPPVEPPLMRPPIVAAPDPLPAVTAPARPDADRALASTPTPGTASAAPARTVAPLLVRTAGASAAASAPPACTPRPGVPCPP